MDNSGGVTAKEFYDVLKRNIINDRDLKELRQTVQQVFYRVKKNAKGEISKEELSAAIRANIQIKEIIEKNFRQLRNVDKWISSDLAKPFQNKISLSLTALYKKYYKN